MHGPVYFIENKYRATYLRIVDRARDRVLAGPGEWHHVLPRSLGGRAPRAFCVRLTYREHFLAHWLLVKFTARDAQRKMNYALGYMRNSRRVLTSWQYARAAEAKRAAGLGRKASAEARAKMSAAALGNKNCLGHKPNAETRAKISAALLGNRRSVESIAKTTAALLGNKHLLGHKHSAETRAKISAAKLGKKPSAEARAKLSAAMLGHKNSLGHKHSAEARANMSAAQRRRFNRRAAERRVMVATVSTERRMSGERRMALVQ